MQNGSQGLHNASAESRNDCTQHDWVLQDLDHALRVANITPQVFWDIAVGRFGNGQVAVLFMLVPFVAFLFHVTVFMGYVSRWEARTR
jgi:hypothetical protein